jgi:hypothetical protein
MPIVRPLGECAAEERLDLRRSPSRSPLPRLGHSHVRMWVWWWLESSVAVTASPSSTRGAMTPKDGFPYMDYLHMRGHAEPTALYHDCTYCGICVGGIIGVQVLSHRLSTSPSSGCREDRRSYKRQ